VYILVMYQIDSTVLLTYLAEQLAAPLSALADQFHVPVEDARKSIKPLLDRNLIKTDKPEDGPDTIYSITANGVMELSKTAPKGFLTRSF